MKKLTAIFLFLALPILGLAACSPTSEQTASEPIITRPAGIIAEGRLMPVNSLDQAFSLPGQVAEVLVKDGESVLAGQVLARLQDSPEAQAMWVRAGQEVLAAQQARDGLTAAAQVNLAQGRLAVIEAQKQVETSQELYEEDATDENKARLEAAEARLAQLEETQSELEKGAGIDPDLLAASEARLAAAEAAVASAQAAVEALDLKANMDGTVVDLSLQAGQWVAAGQPVITLADYSRWVVKTDNLTEDEVAGITVGQAVEITLDALPEVPLSGEVVHINSRYEEKRGDITFTVTLVLKQTDPAMRWGMTAAVQFVP